ncbi:UNVERIFIED_CONTAM: hypothetical protein RMT77_010984 [Armadillidium vulgare]
MPEGSERCDVCSEIGREKEKLLKKRCNHIYCMRCLEMYTEKGIPCWKCSLNFDLTAFRSVPMHSEFYEQSRPSLSRQSESVFQSQLQDLKKDYKDIKLFLERNLRIISQYLTVANSNYQKIDDLITSDSEDSWTSKINKLERFSHQYESIRDRTHLRYGIPLIFSNLQRNHFSNKLEYIYKIYNLLNSKRNVYGVHRIDTKLAYAKFSLHEGKILMHSFSYSDVPPNSTVLLFEEFKQVYCEQETLQTFFQIFCKDIAQYLLIIIDMNVSKNCSRFIKFCSGEFGFSFKYYSTNTVTKPMIPSQGLSGHERMLMALRNETLPCFLKIDDTCKGKTLPYDYNADHLNEDAPVLYKENNVIVQLCPDKTIGFFNIIKPQQKYPSIGIVSSPKDLYCLIPNINLNKVKPHKVYDCGISIPISK